MSVTLWRIGADTPTYTADDMSGTGSSISGGRWNPKTVPVVYTSTSRALACLETIVHYNAGGLPMNRYLVEITVPDAVWAAATVETEATLPVGWDAEPPGMVSINLGEAWIAGRASALMTVPSIIVPEEANVLINPAHPDSSSITTRKVRKWRYDPRLGR